MEPTFRLSGSYFGGKGAAGVVHTILNQVPIHDTWISGFLGFCHPTRYKRPAARNIGIDLDPAVIATWRDAPAIAGASITLLNESFLNWDDVVLYNPKTFLYLDPVYLQETRTSGKRYRFEMTRDHHIRLLDLAKFYTCMVAISCYDSPLYRDSLKGWRKIQFKSQTRGGQRTETLYMNYPQPAPHELHDPRFLGTDFREREKEKRQIETIKRKITRLEPTAKARLSEWLRGQV